MAGIGITEKQINNAKEFYTPGMPFVYNGIHGTVIKPYNHFLLVMMPNGYRECFCWTELLATDR